MSEFKNINHKIILKHKCVHEWEISPKKHIYYKQGCPSCNMSHGERETKMILESLCIKFNIQHTIIGCRNKRLLPFDFYLPTFNTCIGYDGVQHFEAIDKFNGEIGLINRNINDKIKNDYCRSNNIKLIRIPYW